jgi:hypothetical protein
MAARRRDGGGGGTGGDDGDVLLDGLELQFCKGLGLPFDFLSFDWAFVLSMYMYFLPFVTSKDLRLSKFIVF